MPALVSVTDQTGEARYPAFKAIMASKKKPVQTLSLADLGIAPNEVGFDAAASRVRSLSPRPPRQAGTVVVDEGEGASQIADFLAANPGEENALAWRYMAEMYAMRKAQAAGDQHPRVAEACAQGAGLSVHWRIRRSRNRRDTGCDPCILVHCSGLGFRGSSGCANPARADSRRAKPGRPASDRYASRPHPVRDRG